MMAGLTSDHFWMDQALEEAGKAFDEGEVPVGAVAVFEGRMIAADHNRVEQSHDATRHAEMMVLRETAKQLGRWRLSGVTLYVTVEPCPMCAMAMVLCRVDRVVVGACEPRTGAISSFVSILGNPRLNHVPSIDQGIKADECSVLLKRFFKNRREQ